jgi:hypothetical protein
MKFLEKRLQTIKAMVFGSGKHTRRLQHVVKTDVMLSPGTTSLEIISIGRGRIPFHGPIFWKSIGPRQGRVDLQRLYLKNIKLARLSILILSKAYPGLGIL